MSWLALDIGGANLKIADGVGYAATHAFRLWERPQELAAQLTQLIAAAPPANHIAVTMTGELCDCFATKSEGVTAILDAAQSACGDRELRVFLTDGRLVPIAEARQNPLLAAASNWLALATFACRFCDHTGLLIDVGSTTTDIAWLSREGPVVEGLTDSDRLATGELFYQGVERTPLCAFAVGRLKWRGRTYSLASEYFAAMADVYLLLHDLDEQPENYDTADGRPRTFDHARARIARMICADPASFTHNDAVEIAQAYAEWQVHFMEQSAIRVLERHEGFPRLIITSGQGEFVARRLFMRKDGGAPSSVFSRGQMSFDSPHLNSIWGGRTLMSLNKKLGPLVSRCAPAHALAVIAREEQEAAEQPRP